MRYIILIISFLVTAAFLVANWAVVTKEAPVDLFFTKTTAPIGLILVLIFGVLLFIFVCTMVFQQSAALMGYRKILKDRDAQRSLAQDAENSRVERVKKELDSRLQVAMDERRKDTEALEQRLSKAAQNQLESLKTTVNQMKESHQELAKSVHEALQTLDDKVTKALISANHVAHAIGLQNGAAEAAKQLPREISPITEPAPDPEKAAEEAK